MNPYIHIHKPAGIEWRRTGARAWRVTIRREPETYYVLNAAYLAPAAQSGLQAATRAQLAHMNHGIQAADIRPA